MKKLILGLAAITAFVGANAQMKTTSTSLHVHYGLEAGINDATLFVKQSGVTETVGSQVGFNGGVFVELPVSNCFSIQPEVTYSQMGTKAGTTGRYHLDYINVPVLAKYNVGGLAVYAGPQIGFLMNAKEKASGTTTDVKDEFKSIDFAGVFGTEYTFACGFRLSARYQMGLVKINDSSFPGTGDIRNQAWTFTVGYRIR